MRAQDGVLLTTAATGGQGCPCTFARLHKGMFHLTNDVGFALVCGGVPSRWQALAGSLDPRQLNCAWENDQQEHRS